MLGLATSPDGVTWTRHPDNPLVRGQWVEDVMVVKDDGRYYAYYHGCATTGPNARKWSFAVAASDDLFNWEKYPGNPLLPVAENRSSGILVDTGSGSGCIPCTRRVPPYSGRALTGAVDRRGSPGGAPPGLRTGVGRALAAGTDRPYPHRRLYDFARAVGKLPTLTGDNGTDFGCPVVARNPVNDRPTLSLFGNDETADVDTPEMTKPLISQTLVVGNYVAAASDFSEGDGTRTRDHRIDCPATTQRKP
jgi:hypothetical protein